MRAYFVTLRTWRRGSLFGRIAHGKMRPNSVGREIADCWNSLPNRFNNLMLDAFVVMPDHLHGIVMVDEDAPLPSILDSFRTSSVSRVDCGIWKGRGRKHAIRDSDELNRIRQYIRDNPSRWPQDPRDLPPFSRS